MTSEDPIAPNDEHDNRSSTPLLNRRIMGWAVHFYTSLGLPINLFSLWALTQGDCRLFFCLNLLAVLVDATDGFMARKLNLKSLIPYFDGAKLDDLIDYLTFTFLPIASLYYLKLVPSSYTWLLCVALMSSAYGFCQTHAKTEDAFVGFPSYWNLVAYYFFLMQPPMWLIIVITLLFSVMTFMPIHFIYPTRTKMWMKTTLIGSLFYVLLLIYSVFGEAEYRVLAGSLSLIYVVYYWIASIIHHVRIHKRVVGQTHDGST
jgi:phosphatidylcholine synthase